MLFNSLENWKGEYFISHFHPETGTWIFIAIHDSSAGPATGGTRMMTYDSPLAAAQDAMRLSENMTYKFRAAAFPRGGGKAVLAVPKDLSAAGRISVLLHYGTMIRELNGLFYTGPDIGTSSADMDIIAEVAPGRVFSRSAAKGGAGSSAPATALSTLIAIRATSRFLYGTERLAGRKILIQGLGSVGSHLLSLLQKEKAELIVTDVDPAKLSSIKAGSGIQVIDQSEVYSTPCDIFSPCALGGIINDQTVGSLACRAIVGAANNQLSDPGIAQLLKQRNILYAPDFVVNCGGAVVITAIEAMGFTLQQAEQQLEKISDTLSGIYETAKKSNISTLEAAHALVSSPPRTSGLQDNLLSSVPFF